MAREDDLANGRSCLRSAWVIVPEADVQVPGEPGDHGHAVFASAAVGLTRGPVGVADRLACRLPDKGVFAALIGGAEPEVGTFRLKV